ncbi:hypothetical protein FY528_05315 [Hymenobacter lutimineralis]|uniref:Uncharacterized protein n=1 Tax=Hymenobacter lutimineralis TaxID=2606448 RepID=A0A5D6VBK0_9BACT|nr:hypothetical protein [Hymenobacter lutimineralis]TYZ12710.1 hypothetical protein FY528_05315 [Hymenobacter lutimineralis]
MFLTQVLDLPLTPAPIVSSLYKSRCEDMAVVSPGPQWLGNTLCIGHFNAALLTNEQLPYLSKLRAHTTAEESTNYGTAEHFHLRSESPVLAGIASSLFQHTRSLVGTEYEVLSDLADELALAQSLSSISGMR